MAPKTLSFGKNCGGEALQLFGREKIKIFTIKLPVKSFVRSFYNLRLGDQKKFLWINRLFEVLDNERTSLTRGRLAALLNDPSYRRADF
ncbi:MAG: hypothetical protein HYT42_01095 [Candidatus Sungbacteria bacterium]|nr:hypothetical protein [Candidatus Sungbacteria bacterium]